MFIVDLNSLLRQTFIALDQRILVLIIRVLHLVSDEQSTQTVTAVDQLRPTHFSVPEDVQSRAELNGTFQSMYF